MGIIVSLLVATQAHFAGATGWLSHFHLRTADHVPLWIVLSAHIAIALGTAMGGWRIVKTMGSRITKLRPFGGFCAETGGGIAIMIATHLGVPVSTTHTITGAIVGVGAAQRVSAVRWGVAGRIVWAWILTIPMSAAIAAVTYLSSVSSEGRPGQPFLPPPPRSPPAAARTPDSNRAPSRCGARRPPDAAGGRRRSAAVRSPSSIAFTLSGATSQALSPCSENSRTPPDAATRDGSPEPIASSSELPNVSVGEGKVNTSAEA